MTAESTCESSGSAGRVVLARPSETFDAKLQLNILPSKEAAAKRRSGALSESLLSGGGGALPARPVTPATTFLDIDGELAVVRWYAVHTFARHEKKVLEYFKHANVSALLPTYIAIRRWTNRTVANLELPLFPGYLFIQSNLENRLQILCTPGVISLVGSGAVPTPADDAEIDLLANRIRQFNPMPYPYMKVGDPVRVRMGPLTGTIGKLIRSKQNFRLVISMNLIGQSVSVEVDAADVEPLPANFSSTRSRVLYVPPEHVRTSVRYNC